MRKRSKILAFVLALALAMSMLSACGGNDGGDQGSSNEEGSGGKEEAKEGNNLEDGQTGSTANQDNTFDRKTEEGTLTVGTMAATEGFDPTSSTNYMGEQLVYETLFYINPDTGEPEGMLAEKWEFRDDTHLYVKLYDNATFSNGEAVTCEDVIWSWYRTVEAQSSEAQNLVFINWDDIAYISDKEMVIGMNESFAPAVNFMCMFAWASVLDKSAMEHATADDFWSKPVGSGPYTVVENVAGTGTTYALREDYWNTTTMPEAKTIYVKNYTDAATLMIDYETGALDIAFNLTSNDASRVINGEVTDSNYKILNNCDVMSVAYPEYTECLRDPKVREALSIGLDMQAIVDVVWGDLGTVASSLLPAFLPQAVDVGAVEYNPERAMELLAEAGYDSSHPLELSIVIVNEAMLEDLATMVQEQWKAIGVNLTVDSCDLSTAIGHYMKGETDIIFDKGGGMSSYHPYEILQMSTKDSSNATIRITDEGFNALCVTGKTAIDEEESMQAYADAQKYLKENWLRAPIAEQYSVVVYRPYVADVRTLGGTDNCNIRWVDMK